jgi:hypothetical protein
LDNLRLLTIPFVDFSGGTQLGQMVVNRDVVKPIRAAFKKMYAKKFPIRKMRLVDYYGASDMRSMKDDNTSAFNCRTLPGSSTWSQHALGRAVDINPLENPCLCRGGLEPSNARPYVNRSRHAKGMINEGGFVVRTFDRLGWGWGGRYRFTKDWQHFSANGW